jgi:hypothetical protein
MGRLIILLPLRITLRVAEPEARAGRLRFCFSANGLTGQGLGEASAASGAGNAVLAEGPS